MVKREFVQPTNEEIEKRRKMYEEAESLGIDLMGYDGSCHSSEDRRDIVKTIVLLGTGKEVPQDLKERILKKKNGIAIKVARE